MIGRKPMPMARTKGHPRPSRSRTVFICCRISAEALDQVFTTHGKALDAVNDLVRQQPMALPDGTVAVPVPPPDPPRPAQQRAAQRQARRQAHL